MDPVTAISILAGLAAIVGVPVGVGRWWVARRNEKIDHCIVEYLDARVSEAASIEDVCGSLKGRVRRPTEVAVRKSLRRLQGKGLAVPTEGSRWRRRLDEKPAGGDRKPAEPVESPAPLRARLRKTPAAPQVRPRPPKPDFVPPYPLQPNFTGRVNERRMLTGWLTGGNQPVMALIAIGGMGKSALTWAWLQRDVLGLPLPGHAEESAASAKGCRVADEQRPEGVLWWSFYEREARFASFLDEALAYASGGRIDPAAIRSPSEKVRALFTQLQQRRILLVLDGFERELRAYEGLDAAYRGDKTAGDENGCVDPHAGDFLEAMAASHQGRVLLTSRLVPKELQGPDGPLAGCRREDLHDLDPEDAVTFFQSEGIQGTRAEIGAAIAPYGRHPLSLRLLAGAILRDPKMRGDIRAAGRHTVLDKLRGKEQHHILQVAYDEMDEAKRGLLSRFAAFRSPMDYEALLHLNPFKSEDEFDQALEEMESRGLLFIDEGSGRYDLHPIVRQYAYDRLGDKEGVHSRLRDYFDAVPAPDKVESVGDLAPVIELYHHTVGAGRYDEARELFRDRLNQLLYYRFGAYQMRIELLSALFQCIGSGKEESSRGQNAESGHAVGSEPIPGGFHARTLLHRTRCP